MIRWLALTACLMSLVLAAIGVAAQDTVCENFSTSPAECGYPYGCKSNNLDTIINDDGPGPYHIEYETFTCSGANPQCNSTSQIPVSVPNPYCSGGGGGGGDDDDDDCGGKGCLVEGPRPYSSRALPRQGAAGALRPRAPLLGGFYRNGELYDEAPFAALPSSDDPMPRPSREGEIEAAPPAADLSRAIASATGYLERACGPDGRFTYQIDLRTGKDPSYSIIRHAGTMYALAMLYHHQPDPKPADTILRAAAFLRQNYVGPGIRPDQLVVWSAPLPERSDAHLGATGLGLVALAAAHEIDPKSIPLEDLRALGQFLLFLQRDDGSFVSKYRVESGPVPDWESLYYPGEAALGLIALYETDHSRQWLDAAAKALLYLAKSRAGVSTVPADHWALIATARLLPYCDRVRCVASRKELVQHAVQICASILREQITNPVLPSLDGAFDASSRTAPAASRLEGLLAAEEFLPKELDQLRTQIRTATDRGVVFLLQAQIAAGPYTGGMPGAIGEGEGASIIRIDYVQHAMCAWLSYQELSQSNAH